jgi:Helix-hairpin-helix motif
VLLSAATSNLADYDTPAIRPTVVPPGGYLVLENYDPRDPSDANRDPRAAGYRPAASGLPLAGVISGGRFAHANFAFVPNLNRVLDKELVILRPPGAQYMHERIHHVDYDGTTNPAVIRYHGAAGAIDMVPLDVFDLTGLPRPAQGAQPAVAWHYTRASHAPAIAGDVDKAWHFVYPGRYDASQSTGAGGSSPPRFQGTQVASWDPGTQEDPWVQSPPSPGLSLGTDGGSATSGLNFDATYPREFAVRVADMNGVVVSSPSGPTGNRYPFGGFARRADILKIPFIGAYRVQLDEQVGSNRLLELNALTLDSVFAEDTDLSDDAPASPEFQEQIGRFAPTAMDLAIAAEGEAASITATALIDPRRTEPADTWAGYELLITDALGRQHVRAVVASDPVTGSLQFAPSKDGALPAGSRYALRAGHYAWAARLFDYVDVLAPHGECLPNTNPAGYAYPDTASGQLHPIDPAPMPVAHYPRTVVVPGLAIEGQININSAPWKVLATVPFFEHADRNDELAREIVAWRDAHGPFRSLFDLYRVPEFVEANRQAAQLSGRTMPADFERQYFLLWRVGNVLTTRSDSFTCYVLVQGWRGVGTATPTLEVQRRRAFIVDRSGSQSVSPDLAVQPFNNP